ncbi:MAG: hypothetical protein ACE5IR_15250 [bacterium]
MREKMPSRLSFLALVVTIVSVTGTGLQARVPPYINYQGQLTDDNGNPLNGTFSIEFRIYDSLTDGTIVWGPEIHSKQIDNGLFNVLLGSQNQNGIPLDLFDSNPTVYLEIRVDGVPLSPRSQFASVPFAFTSRSTGNGDNVWTLSGNNIYRNVGNVGIGTTSPTEKLDVNGIIRGSGLEIVSPGSVHLGANDATNEGAQIIWDGAAQFPQWVTDIYRDHYRIFTVSPNSGNTHQVQINNADPQGTAGLYVQGNVGIGTSDPSEKLAVAGTIYSTVGGFRFPDGTIQTTAATGNGGGDNDWVISGNNIYSANSGNVGIGSTSPSAKLTVESVGNSAAYGASALFIPQNQVYFDYSGLRFRGGGGSFNARFTGTSLVKPDGEILGIFKEETSPGNLGDPIATFNNNGNVGIGIRDPNETFQVAGVIHSTTGGYKFPDGTIQTTAAAGGGGADNDWTISGNNIYRTNGRVGIGTSAVTSGPTLLVHGNTNNSGAARFSYSLQDDDNILEAVYTGPPTGDDMIAVYGKATPLDFWGIGGYFEGGFKGVEGRVSNASDNGTATYYGVRGSAHNSAGRGTNYGVFGIATGSGGEPDNIGVYGEASGGVENIGVYGKAADTEVTWAGFFEGPVRVTGFLSKGGGGFKIDHPLDPTNKYLNHSFVESPDMMNVYNGNVTLDGNGEAWIELPTWFEALNKDFRYQLTCVGGFAPVYIAEKISDNRFRIAGGQSGLEVSWQVTGIRHDRFAEENRFAIEEEKRPRERGKYIHPREYGLSETMGVHYRPEVKKQK